VVLCDGCSGSDLFDDLFQKAQKSRNQICAVCTRFYFYSIKKIYQSIVTTSEFIPDYKKYTTFQLFEVYRRMDRNDHPERLKAIENEIKNRMDLPEETDLSEKLDIYELDNIYKNYFEKEKREERIKKDSRYLYVILNVSLILSLVSFYSGFIKKDLGSSPLIVKMLIVVFIVLTAIGWISNLAKEQIEVRGIRIKKTENPRLFYSYIIISLVVIILFFFSII
jgi:hypothetical protein